MGRAREQPHLNLPDDVTTPGRTPGQWEAASGRGRGPEDSGPGAGRQLAGSVATAGEGSASGAAVDATATSRMVPSRP